MLTLDDRYRQFRDATAEVFAAIPELEPLRFFVFKELVVNGRGAGITDVVKHWLRFARGLGGIACPSHSAADVLLWVESRRDVLVEPILAVHARLQSMGITSVIASFNSFEHLPGPVIRFAAARPGAVPTWAKRGWDGLESVLPALGEPRLRRAFEIQACGVSGLFSAAEQLLDLIRPAVVVNASNNPVASTTLVIAARRRGITTLLLQHGVPQVFYTPLLNDVMLTWGTRSTAALVRLGVAPEKLRVTGSPRHDAFLGVDRNAARQALLRAHGLPNRLTLVFFSNGNDLQRNGIGPVTAAEWLEHAAELVADVNVVARLHPNEDGRVFAPSRKVVIMKREVGVMTALAGADVVASQCSTALDEAVLFGKPVWQFEGDGWPELASNWRDGLAARVGSAGELVSHLQAALAGAPAGRCDAGLADSVFANRGRAAEVAAAAIAQLIGRPVCESAMASERVP